MVASLTDTNAFDTDRAEGHHQKPGSWACRDPVDAEGAYGTYGWCAWGGLDGERH